MSFAMGLHHLITYPKEFPDPKPSSPHVQHPNLTALYPITQLCTELVCATGIITSDTCNNPHQPTHPSHSAAIMGDGNDKELDDLSMIGTLALGT